MAAPRHRRSRAAPEPHRLTVVDTGAARPPSARGAATTPSPSGSSRPAFDLGIPPERVAKFSGIGCSSKSPAYFLSRSHAFNSVHGRMPSVATGALLANKHLLALGVSGDGDNRLHRDRAVRAPHASQPAQVYVVENNGVYASPRGSFSATADMGSVLKGGAVNDLPPSTPARWPSSSVPPRGASFSGDKKQLLGHAEGALVHRGIASSTCSAPASPSTIRRSTKELRVLKEQVEPLQEISSSRTTRTSPVEYDPGTPSDVRMHDGSRLRLRKLERTTIRSRSAPWPGHGVDRAGHRLTGRPLRRPDAPDFLTRLGTVERAARDPAQDCGAARRGRCSTR